jgi:hypothetical protein
VFHRIVLLALPLPPVAWCPTGFEYPDGDPDPSCELGPAWCLAPDDVA